MKVSNMNDDYSDVEEALRVLYEYQVNSIAPNHSSWTPDCIPLPQYDRYPEAMTPTQRRHTESCDYCKQILQYRAWVVDNREEAPDWRSRGLQEIDASGSRRSLGKIRDHSITISMLVRGTRALRRQRELRWMWRFVYAMKVPFLLLWMLVLFTLGRGRCRHAHTTTPRKRRLNSVSTCTEEKGEMYVVCLDCAQELAYDWEEMRLRPNGRKDTVRDFWATLVAVFDR